MRSFTHSRLVRTAAICIIAVALGGLLFGAAGGAVGAAASLLFAAVRHDNDLGTCFPLALLFLIVLAVLTILMWMLAMVGSS